MAIAGSRRLCAVSRLFAASARSVTGVSSVWIIFTAALIWVPPNRRIDTPQSENRTSRPLGIGGESEAGAAGISQGLERVVHLTEAVEAKQQAPELVLPGEHPFDGLEPLVEKRRVEQRLVASLWLLSAASVGIDVGA